MRCEDSSSACYGQSVCEAKINPAPKSIAKKLVTKESPLAAKDTIIAPRVSTPAVMCFGSIINLAILHQGTRQGTYRVCAIPDSMICVRFCGRSRCTGDLFVQ